MEIHLTPEEEIQLSQLAVQRGKGENELAREVFTRGLSAEAHFTSSVEAGREAARRGDFAEPADLWASIEHILQS